MKATPIAEFLARKSGDMPGPRDETPPNPFAARRASVPNAGANDDELPDFRRSGLMAALARRTTAEPPLVRPLEAAALPTRREPPRSPPPPPPHEPARDVEQELSEAYHRGVQEGLDAGKAEAATARALERAEWQKRAVVEKLDFQMNEFARLSETVANAFAEMEKRVGEAVARLLKPLVKQAVAKEIVEELAENLARLTRSGSAGLLKVRGPENLLGALKEKIEALAVDVEYVETEGVEIVVGAGATEIGTELAAWGRLIDSVVEG